MKIVRFGGSRERKQVTSETLQLLNPELYSEILSCKGFETWREVVKNKANRIIDENPAVPGFINKSTPNHEDLYRLRYCDLAAIRLLDYLEFEGTEVEDPNTHKWFVSEPLHLVWRTVHKNQPVHPDFLDDFIHLFRQLNDKRKVGPASRDQVEQWMNRHPSGLDPEMVEIRKQNKERILSVILKYIDNGTYHDEVYTFPPGADYREKMDLLNRWWNEKRFHLKFAVRSPGMLNEMLGNTLNEETLKILNKANEKGIPFFINPYYLSLIRIREGHEIHTEDLAIRSYVLYSRSLVEEFGQIEAWEKEDQVVPGKPNAAGWHLPPYNNIHRRYPESAIIIPDSMGRACGGLCSSCQRMYDFQSGHLNFNLEKLAAQEKWQDKQKVIFQYFREDTQLRDILITGGDALMSSNVTLRRLLQAVLELAKAKNTDNRKRPEGQKYAGIIKVRLGTRLPVYLPQRIDDHLVEILRNFRREALKLGIRQFFIQTHFETAMEITPEAAQAIRKLRSTGWLILNQMVFTAAASRRGHATRLRKELNRIGILPYYTFSVKGYRENREVFATNARLVQEQVEEKYYGRIHKDHERVLRSVCESNSEQEFMLEQFRSRKEYPFLATDRSILNLPGIGKSLTFRTIGILPDGRRILYFDHDHSRNHSPVIKEIGKITIVESKSIASYLRQLEQMGENPEEYATLFHYSAGITEPQFPLFRYPDYPWMTTDRINHHLYDCKKVINLNPENKGSDDASAEK